MKKHLFFAAVALLLTANILVLARVAFNRSAVSARIILSEREFQSPYNAAYTKEDSSKHVYLQWRTPAMGDDDHGYNKELSISDAEREAIGFGHACATNRSTNETHEAWLLMELGGEAYEQDLRRMEIRVKQAQETNENTQTLDRMQTEWEQMRDTGTRLYGTAIAADPDRLKAAIKDKYRQFVVKAVVADGNECKSTLTISRISLQNLYIPREVPGNMQPLPTHYQVQIAIGRQHEPWIEKIDAR